MPVVLDRPRTGPPPGAPPPSGGGTEGLAPDRGVGGAWPRTNRFLPWLIAAFLVMVWLVPFDSMQLRVNLPVDAKLDRLVVAAMGLLWVASILAGGRLSPRWWRDPIEGLVLAFVLIAILSVVLNGLVLARQDQVDEAVKKLALLTSYAAFFFIVTTTVRAPEVPRLLRLFHLLSLVAAALVLVQYFTGRNLFFELFRAVVPGGAVDFRPVGGNSRFVAEPITGPARHALALAAMFAMALAVALVYLVQARAVRDRVLHGLGVVLLLGAVFATSRKTGTFAGAAVIITLTVLRPADMVKLLPAAAAAFAIALVYAPAAVDTQLRQISPGQITSGVSGEARSADYEAIVPDVREYPITGRGFGTYEPRRFRILDNNYLGLLLETGFLGVAAFTAMVLAVPWRARRIIRSGDAVRAPAALAAAGAAAAIAAAMALFDAFSFAQVPYMFFFFAGLVVVCGAEGAGTPAPGRWRPPAGGPDPSEAPTLDRPRLTPRQAAHVGGRLRDRRLPPRRPGTPPAPPRPKQAAPEGAPPSAPPGPRRSRRGRRLAAMLVLIALGAAVLSQGGTTGNAPPALADAGDDSSDLWGDLRSAGERGESARRARPVRAPGAGGTRASRPPRGPLAALPGATERQRPAQPPARARPVRRPAAAPKPEPNPAAPPAPRPGGAAVQDPPTGSGEQGECTADERVAQILGQAAIDACPQGGDRALLDSLSAVERGGVISLAERLLVERWLVQRGEAAARSR